MDCILPRHEEDLARQPATGIAFDLVKRILRIQSFAEAYCQAVKSRILTPRCHGIVRAASSVQAVQLVLKFFERRFRSARNALADQRKFIAGTTLRARQCVFATPLNAVPHPTSVATYRGAIRIEQIPRVLVVAGESTGRGFSGV